MINVSMKIEQLNTLTDDNIVRSTNFEGIVIIEDDEGNERKFPFSLKGKLGCPEIKPHWWAATEPAIKSDYVHKLKEVVEGDNDE